MVPYALVGGALSRTRQNAVDNRLGSTATPITSTSDIESSAPFTATGVTTTGDGTAGSAQTTATPASSASPRRHRDRRQAEAIRRPYSARGAQGYRTPGKAAPAHRRPRGAIYRVTGRSPSGSSLAGRSTNSRLKGQDVKLGPNRARRGFASSPAQAANRQKPLIGRGFSSFPQGREIARLQVVWSWHPLLMSS